MKYSLLLRYKYAKIKKRRNQKKIPVLFYLENSSSSVCNYMHCCLTMYENWNYKQLHCKKKKKKKKNMRLIDDMSCVK